MKPTEIEGLIDQIRRSGVFHEAWYREKHATHVAANDDPIVHYLREGAACGFDPASDFRTEGYLRAYPDVEKAGMNPLVHYVKSGKQEGRSPTGEVTVPTNGVRLDGRLPRFGKREYGPIDTLLSYDREIELAEGFGLRICVHLHLFHQEMWDGLVGYLANIQVPVTLLLSLSHPTRVDYIDDVRRRLPHVAACIVKTVPNRGRDVAPWVVDFREQILEHDLLLHIHSKRSDYNDEYRGWRSFLLHNTVGSRTTVNQILNLFHGEERLGLVYPPYFGALPGQPRWGANRSRVEDLLRQLGLHVNLQPQCMDYPAGSFFWMRAGALKPLLEHGIDHADFEEEAGQIDGTLGHAIERLLGLLPECTGFKKRCAGVDVAHNLVNYWNTERARAVEPSGLAAASQVKPSAALRRVVGHNRIAVFTCISGGFDELVPPVKLEEGVDYYIFSDEEFTPPWPYRLAKCRYVDVGARRTARHVKTHPHFLLRDYEVAVWIDGNIVPTDGILKYVEAVRASGNDLGLIAHPIRTSYIEEADECARIRADDPAVIEEQKQRYVAERVPGSGLIETNVVVSFIQRPAVRRFYDAWWRELCRYSLRDQISVNKVLAESSATYSLIVERGRSVRDAEGFLIFAHDLQKRAAVVEHVINRSRMSHLSQASG